MRKQLAATAAAALVAFSAIPPAPAQAAMVVYDPAAVAQAIRQVAQGLQQINNLKQQVAYQAQMLQRLGTDVTHPLSAISAQATSLMQSATGIGYSGADVAMDFQTLYPSSMGGSSLSQILAKYANWQQNQRATMNDALRLQNQIVASQPTTAYAVNSAVSASQSAQGQTAAIQATNQLLAALSSQLQTLQTILVAQARTQETILAQQQASTAAAQAESTRHDAYTPTTSTLGSMTSF
ncbi:P-type conjugative transfer protein TrbJ [Phenylobacterium sp. LjRoot225]|uniref:P-type conjugative transfer protein TrbJ n=1 Tax=Phenylobacterium sp. LjRoot225 TaxID=3342285 RepID=UPI003ECCEBEE